MSPKNNITVLIAPLDWGLGHATRCVPLINYFLKLQCIVVIAANGKQENLLKKEFPSLLFVPLPDYNIHYPHYKRFFFLKIIFQIPKILKAIQLENNWLKRFVANNHVNIIVSDNRYGFFHKSVPSIFLTHQLTIKANISLAETILRKINYKYINRFSICWIPDEEGMQNLAGKLSHPLVMPKIPVVYLGGLSRFNLHEKCTVSYKLLIVLSGPEPQRTLLEKKLLKQLTHFAEPVLFVRGLPGSIDILPEQANITFHNHLPAKQMEQAFEQSELIVSRSGYTTVMDLCKMQKKSILIPTPGQTEQEYLAIHLQSQGFCLAANQEDFNLSEELKRAEKFDYRFQKFDMGKYQKVVEGLVENIAKQRM